VAVAFTEKSRNLDVPNLIPRSFIDVALCQLFRPKAGESRLRRAIQLTYLSRRVTSVSPLRVVMLRTLALSMAYERRIGHILN